MPIRSIRESVCNYLQCFNSCRDQPRSVKQVRRRTWLPPILGEYKTNFDDVMISEGDEARIGIVVRHSSGQVLAAMAEKIQKPHSMECLEVIAMRCAVINASSLRNFYFSHMLRQGNAMAHTLA